MSEKERKKLQLFGGSPELTGSADEITMSVTCHRKNRRGKFERYQLEVNFSRHSIQHLVRQIATLHVRDRVRISRELNRIEHEIDAIKQPDTAETAS